MTLAFLAMLAPVLAISLLYVYPYPAATSLVAMAVIALPWIVYHKGWFHLPWPVTFAAGSVLVLHSWGIFLRLYDLLWWWDTMTHMMATLIIALLVSLALMSANRKVRNFSIPIELVPVLTLASVILLGAMWEVMEFIFDGALGLTMQYSLDDTATDLTFDILGGGLVALVMLPLLDQVRLASQKMFIARATSSSSEDR